MIEKMRVVAPTTAVPMSTGLAVALKVFPAPSFSSRYTFAFSKSASKPNVFLMSCLMFGISSIEEIPNIKQDIKKTFGFEADFENAKVYLEENDGAGNTFKATAKPVLIGTAVVGATTLIFSIIQLLSAKYGTVGPQGIYEGLSIMNPLFLLGLITS